ncbi:unnamed protein product [Rhizoctonia solani]|uniref:Peptidase A1 domain-containing protein n=1 Tax=Rhizoctonia solani TaxID=456999 RepID=A0A8H3E930_9AGAM|nr:unnamed protein product [Rhizoctonia solani]
MKSLLVLPLASAALASSSVHIPLLRRSHTGFFTPEDLAAQRDALDSKYHRDEGTAVRPRQNEVGVPMVNQNGDLSYYALMNVGTPPVAYGVALGRPFEIRYGSGAVQGVIVSDHIEMGGFAIQNQVMGLVNQTSGVLLNGNSAGLLGLAFQALSNTQSVPFWEALVASGGWSQPLMSFWMTRFTNVSTVRNEEHGGEFRMGGLNASLYAGEIEYISMPSSIKAYWSIPLRQISVNGGSPMIITNLGVTSLAAIDTGTSLIGGPPDIVANIYGQIPNAQRGTGNLQRYWIYPCSQNVNVAFNFGGRSWTMESADFKLLTTNPNVCVGAIFELSMGGLGNPDVPQWVVGDAFLKNVYSVFRYEPPSIGFAQLSAAALGGQPILQQPAPSSTSAQVAATKTATPNTTGPSSNGGGLIIDRSAGEDMVNQNTDVMYYATVQVGTPSQPYAVILDTGSSDMWLQSVECAPCTGKKINATVSSSLQQSSSVFSLAYGIGSVKGTLVKDIVSIGSSADFTIQNQVWGLVNYTLGTPVPGDIAGLMGLGFKNLAASQATPFWEALVSDNKWHEPFGNIMTELNHDDRYNNVSGASAAELGGEFILGGTNEALYTGDIEFISLTYASNPTFWAIPILTITMNGNDISAVGSSASSALAAIDTATSLIGGPASIVENLYATISGAQRGQGVLEGFWTFRESRSVYKPSFSPELTFFPNNQACSEQVQVTLNFGGRAWPMSSDDFALTTDTPGTCVGAIFETSLGDPNNSQIPQWYIGASFLVNNYLFTAPGS